MKLINVFIVCSLLLNIIMIYKGLDTSVTLTHQQEGLVQKYQQLGTCKTLLTYIYPNIGYQKFLHVSKDAKLDVMQKGINPRGNEEAYIGDILFEFSRDKNLISIDIP